jgi:uncharacterized membrane protein YkoI
MPQRAAIARRASLLVHPQRHEESAMNAKAAIVAGITVAVLGGGGLALAQGDRGAAQASDVRGAATISRSEAERIALGAVGGGRVRETELETEEGVLVWEVEVIARGIEHDLYIDSRTGDVVRHRTDGDDRDEGFRHDDDGPRHDAGDDHGGLRHDDLADDDRHGDDHGDHDGGHHGGDDDDHGGPGEG